MNIYMNILFYLAIHCDMYVKCVCWIQYLCMPNKFRFEYYRRTEHK